MIIHAIEDKVKEVNKRLVKMNHSSLQYISFKYSTVPERIGAMCANEIINVNSQYETLFNIKVHNKVLCENKEYLLNKLLR